MGGEWHAVPIGEIAEIYDGPHATPPKITEGPVFLGISNLAQGRIDLRGSEHVSEDDYTRWTRRVEPSEGDVVFSYETRLGEAAIIPRGLRCCLGRRMGLLRARSGKVDSRFLLYAYLGPQFQETLRSRTIHGSTVDRIPLIDMPSFPIEVPISIEKQRAIAHILGTLDDKIELNRRMNETLEAMARALFKSWFVDFDPVRAKEQGRDPGLPELVSELFPRRLVFDKTLMRDVPEGWQGVSLGDVLSLLKDGSHLPPKRVPNGIRFIAGATDVRHFAIDFSKCTYVTEADYGAMHKKWHVQVGDVLLTIVGTVGNVALVRESDLPFSLQRSIAVLRPKPFLSSSFLYFWLDTGQFKEMLNSLVNPTGQPGVYLGALSRLPLCLPPRRLVERFDAIATACIAKMQSNLAELHTLAALRDALLPRLVSGKLRISEWCAP